VNSNGSILELIQAWPRERVAALIARQTPGDVERALCHDERTVDDLAALLSPHAAARLEDLAREAQRLTRMHFGRTIALYAPIYLSNVCAANCVYCGFSTGARSRDKRITLQPEELRWECASLAAAGFDTVLLLTGEAPAIAGVDYIAHSVAIAREYFSSVSVEIYAMDEAGYRALCASGLDGVTLYMETYDPDTYRRLHLAGAKRDYASRLAALDRAGAAGARRLNIGALLGLFDWRVEGLHMGLHARHLQHHHWRSAAAVSFPRLRHAPPGFDIPAPVNDAALVQLMLALRLFLPEAGFALSTRESAALRNHLIPLGITMMSAGSSTRPGGYATCEESLEQFATDDTRSPREVVEAIIQAGYDPVWKDYDRAFCS